MNQSFICSIFSRTQRPNQKYLTMSVMHENHKSQSISKYSELFSRNIYFHVLLVLLALLSEIAHQILLKISNLLKKAQLSHSFLDNRMISREATRPGETS